MIHACKHVQICRSRNDLPSNHGRARSLKTQCHTTFISGGSLAPIFLLALPSRPSGSYGTGTKGLGLTVPV